MTNGLPLRKILDLQEQGRHEEAEKLFRDNATPAEIDALTKAFADIGSALQGVDWNCTSDILDRYRSAQNNPQHPNAFPWLHIASLTPRQASTFYQRLLDPRARKKGRQKGSGAVASDHALITDMQSLVDAGNAPTTAARILLERRGVKAGIKNRADHLAKVFRKRTSEK